MFCDKKLLNGVWRLYIAENRNVKSFADSICEETQFSEYNINYINGSVPGNFELDMYAAGLIDDPFFGENPHKVQQLENRHLWYATDFDYDADDAGNTYILFEGIDTFADIYLNGVHIGGSDNMFIEHEYQAKGLKQGKNSLLVHIKPAVIEARKYEYDMDVFTHLRYNGGSLSVRKAAHMFGWDILPRFVSGGLWRDVSIYRKPDDRIDDVYIQTTELSESGAELSAIYNLTLSGDFSTEYSLVLEGVCGDSRFTYTIDKLWHNRGNLTFTLSDPVLWWPRDMGKQNLYTVTVHLLHDGKCVAEKVFDFGIRTVKLDLTDTTDDNGNGEFRFVVNGQPVFIRGTNWVPMDAFHSRDKARLSAALDLLYDINCNMVRCWGGNVYEDHEFFDFCDKKGILVWQDFAMGCATYPQDDDFAARLKTEAEFIVKKLRRHPSLALWAGDNECDVASAYWSEGPKQNPAKNRLTRKILPDVISRLDPWRDFLPSSPYVSEAAYRSGCDDPLPENHLWGPRDYFKSDFYTTANAHFASETGYHGCPSPESVKKFISSEEIWPWQDNDEWQMHATCIELGKGVPYGFRNALMANQVDVLFGQKPDTLEEFALLSQLSQGEADKFFIERFRTGKWRRTGLIWWNLIDGWPQFSDAVVDYYYTKKAAYHFIKRCQEPVCLMMREPEDGNLTLVGANEFLSEKSVCYKVTDLADNKPVCEGTAVLSANGADDIAKIPYDDKNTHFYLIEWNLDGVMHKNHYISGPAPYDHKRYIEWLKTGDLLQTEGF